MPYRFTSQHFCLNSAPFQNRQHLFRLGGHEGNVFEIGELAQFCLCNGVKIEGSVLAIPERTELGINLAATIHLDLCDLRGQPRRDRVLLQPLPNLWDGFIPFRVNVDLDRKSVV